ncbi:MAG: hypothetical protein H8E44_31660 [Planctomycetes bacterium]|nr:hypothetical protein [Planctomycetota bacterium]
MKRILLVNFAAASMVAYVAAEEPEKSWRFSTACLRPFWVSQTMHGETVLFLQEQPDNCAAASLLFEPTRILSVRDSSVEILFGATHEYHDMQTIVSYEHKGGWTGPTPLFAGEILSRIRQTELQHTKMERETWEHSSKQLASNSARGQ